MIRLARSEEGEPEADAFLRSVGSDMEAITARDRRLGLLAGERALASLRAMDDVPVGGALVTPAGELPADFLIHVVLRSAEVPVSDQGIRRAFHGGLRQAAEWGIEVLATAPLGTGAGNFEAEDAARIMAEVLREHRMSHLLPRELVVVVASEYEEDAFRRFAEAFSAAAHRDPPASDRSVPPSGSSPDP